MTTTAVFFDVDFTLIYPGPTFRGEGYRRFGERHGLMLDESRFADAVTRAAPVLDAAQGDIYDPAIFHRYTASIIEAMGGTGPGVQTCAVEVYDEWASHHHFDMYDDVPDVLRAIAARGHPDRAHLEQPSAADVVPEPLRAGRPGERGRLVV